MLPVGTWNESPPERAILIRVWIEGPLAQCGVLCALTYMAVSGLFLGMEAAVQAARGGEGRGAGAGGGVEAGLMRRGGHARERAALCKGF